MDIDRDALLTVFFAESDEVLIAFEEALLSLERRPDDAEALAAAFRFAHTLKGNAMSLGFDGLGRLAHAAEDMLDGFRRHEVEVAADAVTLLLESRDAMQEALSDAARDVAAPRASHEKLAERLVERARRSRGSFADSGMAAPTGGGDDDRQRSPAHETLRVGVRRLDELLALVGEIAISRVRLDHLLERGTQAREALESHREADRLYAALQELVFQMRLVPLGPVFRQHQRTVRDLAEVRGKLARLAIEDEDVQVDTSIVGPLRDALVHVVRNAVDHGIEPPEARRACGKDPVGTVSITARRQGGSVAVEVADDGAGLGRERIRARATELGLIEAGAQLSDAELLDLVFAPGLSTAAAVSDTSGRGVGMDVVRRNVESVRGTIGLDSIPGRGTRVVLRLPLTVFSIEALRVRVSGETYVLPVEDVVECLDLPPGHGLRGRETGVVDLRGRPLPCLRLREALGVPGPEPARGNVVVVRREGAEAGLAVDEVLGSGPAVIRRLGQALRRVPGIAGSVILGSGEVALVLDLPAMLKRALRQERVLDGSA